MGIYFDYITSFLQRMENRPPSFAPARKGYVPMRNGQAIGNSGVTIGTGVDLGQQTAQRLADMGISASLIGILTPYIGLKKNAAIEKLRSVPLILSPDAIASFDVAVISSYARATAKRFDGYVQRYSSSNTFFSDRPQQVQAVAVSLTYQLGKGGASVFMMGLAKGTYGDVIQLLNSQKNYKNRRNKEAELLLEIQE